MKEIAGRNLSLKQLYAFVEKTHFDGRLIISLSLLMREMKLQEKKTWGSFSDSFFRKYSKHLQGYLGYRQQDSGVDKMKIEKVYSTLFLNCMGCMKRSGIIPDCSFEKMADHLDKLFETGYAYDTVLNKLKEENPEFWQIEDAINSERKRIRLNEMNKNK